MSPLVVVPAPTLPSASTTTMPVNTLFGIVIMYCTGVIFKGLIFVVWEDSWAYIFMAYSLITCTI